MKMVYGKISIIMGIYNCEETIEEAVDSIVKQTYSNWQLIMCDDCSTDDTYSIVKKIVERYSDKMLLIRNDSNMKLQYTLNRCLEFVDGEYIARMDGDDRCSPYRLEKEINFLRSHPDFAMVSSRMNLFDDNGVYRCIMYGEYPTKKQLIKSSQFCHAGSMIRAAVMNQLNGYSTSVRCERVEDFDLWVRMYQLGYKGYNLQEDLYDMRDDRNAQHRRTLKNRMNESRVCFRAGIVFGSPVYGFYCSTLPIIKWMTPRFIYTLVHKNKRSNLKV